MDRRRFLFVSGATALRLLGGLGPSLMTVSGCGGGGGKSPIPNPGHNPNPDPGSSPDWSPGIVHVHSTFSDGSRTITEICDKAKSLGMSFVIMTDHYEQINSLDKPPIKSGWALKNGQVDVGWGNYIQQCRAQDVWESFSCVAGTEVETIWHAESDTTDRSHTLGIGLWYGTSDYYIDEHLDRKLDAQAGLIQRMRALGWSPTAAHPDFLGDLLPWEQSRFRYDRRTPDAYRGICGIEFWNSDNPGQDQSTLNWYLSMIAKHWPVFVTAGCDSHGWAEHVRDDEERWQRVTWLMPERIIWDSRDGIPAALKAGRSYAANMGAKLTRATFTPGFEKRAASKPLRLAFSCEVPGGGGHCQLYRDGALIGSGSDPANFSCEDTGVTPGEHWYVFVVQDYLVTSPIVLQVGG